MRRASRREQAGAPTPNFVLDVFWLVVATLYLRPVQIAPRLNSGARHHEELRSHIAQIEGNASWRDAALQRKLRGEKYWAMIRLQQYM